MFALNFRDDRSLPSAEQIAAILAEELIEEPLGRRYIYYLAPILHRLFAALNETSPGRADELRVYADVLRGRWEREGHNALNEIQRRLPVVWTLDHVSVFPVFPVSGGGGGCKRTGNTESASGHVEQVTPASYSRAAGFTRSEEGCFGSAPA